MDNKMDNKKLASELLKLAKDLIAKLSPSQVAILQAVSKKEKLTSFWNPSGESWRLNDKKINPRPAQFLYQEGYLKTDHPHETEKEYTLASKGEEAIGIKSASIKTSFEKISPDTKISDVLKELANSIDKNQHNLKSEKGLDATIKAMNEINEGLKKFINHAKTVELKYKTEIDEERKKLEDEGLLEGPYNEK